MPDSSKNRGPGWLRKAVERVRDFAYAEPAQGQEGRRRPRVGLALDGGFARGIAHLGVLRAFRENGIPVDCLAATSAGALLAIAYASGHTFEEIAAQAAATRFKDFGNWKLSWMGLASNQRLEHYPRKYLGVTTFDQLKIPLAISSTDLLTGEAVYFTSGSLGTALRASCAYPGLFVPVELDGKLLVDGFLAAPVPVEAARRLGAEFVIAVALEGESTRTPTSVVDVIGRSFRILQRHAEVEWRQKADVILEPDVKQFAWDDFERTPELLAAGATAALAALPAIRAALEAGARAADSLTPAQTLSNH